MQGGDLRKSVRGLPIHCRFIGLSPQKAKKRFVTVPPEHIVLLESVPSAWCFCCLDMLLWTLFFGCFTKTENTMRIRHNGDDVGYGYARKTFVRRLNAKYATGICVRIKIKGGFLLFARFFFGKTLYFFVFNGHRLKWGCFDCRSILLSNVFLFLRFAFFSV